MKKIVLLITITLLVILSILIDGMKVFGEDQKKTKKVYVKPDFVLIMTYEPGGKETDQFDCREKVYIDFTFEAEEGSNHILEAFWVRPDGKQQEYTRHELIGNRAWLWLKLHSSFGGKLLGGIDPSVGMDDFIGKWKVKIRVDGKDTGKKTFYVAC